MSNPQYPAGQRTITAVVDNAEQQPVPDTLTWTTSSGTITPAADTLSAVLDNAAIGTVTVTASDPGGITGTVTFDVVDATPASVTLSVA